MPVQNISLSLTIVVNKCQYLNKNHVDSCCCLVHASHGGLQALGCLLYEMCALKPAFDGTNLISLIFRIVKETPQVHLLYSSSPVFLPLHLLFTVLLYTVSQKTSHLRLAIIFTYNPITIIFGRSVTEKVRNHTMLCFPTSSIQCFCITLQKRKPKRQCTGALFVQQSNCCSAIDFLSFEPCSQQSVQLNILITRLRESYSTVSMSRESKRLKKSSSWLNSGNALIQHQRENAIFAFPDLPGRTEA